VVELKNKIMQAIEFNTQVLNGIIKVPNRFKDFGNKRVKVILLDDQEEIYLQAKNALLETNQEAQKAGLDTMTMEEINAEIKAYRNGE
jgi:hypothetical protein